MLVAGGGVDLITAHGGALNIVLDSPPNRYYDISFGSANNNPYTRNSIGLFVFFSITVGPVRQRCHMCSQHITSNEDK